MFRSLLYIVLAICCIVLCVAQTVTEENLDCGPNEVLNKCVTCPPEDSCYDRNQFVCLDDLLSPSSCRVACVCKEGYIRKTLDRECIPKEECGAQCDTFEQYTDCKECSKETCFSFANPVNCDSEKPKSCTPGCVCWDGYIRDMSNETSFCFHQCFCPELKNSTYCVQWRS